MDLDGKEALEKRLGQYRRWMRSNPEIFRALKETLKALETQKNLRKFTREAPKNLWESSRDTQKDSTEYDRIFLHVYAPVMTCFVEWVLDETVRTGKKRLYFLSRDGWLMYQTAGILMESRYRDRKKEMPELRYLKVSRYALRRAEYGLLGKDCVGLICMGGMNITLRKMLKRAALSDKEILQTATHIGFGERLDEPLDTRKIRQLKGKLQEDEDFRQLVEEKSRGCLEDTLGYLKQEGLLDPVSMAVVDSGWLGTTQQSLDRLIQEALRRQSCPGRPIEEAVRGQGNPERSIEETVRRQGSPGRPIEGAVRRQGSPERSIEETVRRQSSPEKTGQRGECGKAHLEGYYFGIYGLPEGCDPDSYHGYYITPDAQSPRIKLLQEILSGNLRRKIYFAVCLFETVFSAPEGMTMGYRREIWSNPSRENAQQESLSLRRIALYRAVESGCANPNRERMYRNRELMQYFLAHYKSGSEAGTGTGIGTGIKNETRAQTGIGTGIKTRTETGTGSKNEAGKEPEEKDGEIKKSRNPSDIEGMDQRKMLRRILNCHMGNPTEREAAVLGEMKFCDDVLESGLQSVAARWDRTQVKTQRFFLRVLYKTGIRKGALPESGWPEGSMVNAGCRRAVRQEHRYKFFMYIRKAMM